MKIEGIDIEHVDIEDRGTGIGMCTSIWLKADVSYETMIMIGRGRVGMFHYLYHHDLCYRIYRPF